MPPFRTSARLLLELHAPNVHKLARALLRTPQRACDGRRWLPLLDDRWFNGRCWCVALRLLQGRSERRWLELVDLAYRDCTAW